MGESLFSRRRKLYVVSVQAMDAEMKSIHIESDWTGRQLFDAICRIIGLREIWYFGLQFVNKANITVWLQMEKLISEQEVPKDQNGVLQFYFLVKFYPESVEEELIQDITRHLFFLQIKQSILNMDLYCQAEAAVLLASYAIQASFGDADDAIELNLEKLLPTSVINHYELSPSMWEERIRSWWLKNSGLSAEEAEMEYLRVAQDLEMYGIQYYPIYNQKDTNLLLGVSAQGIGIYETNNRMSPRPFFPWSEIKNIRFKNKQFTICVVDKSKIKFRAQEMSINASILDLCIGTHNLYLRRRQPDPLEVQQMKIQAKEQRQKRIAEQTKYNREREGRIQAENERDKYKNEVAFLTDRLSALQEHIQSADEVQRLTGEKMIYSSRANDLDVQRQKYPPLQYGMAYSSDQTVANSIKHSNSVLHMSNRHSPDNFINNPPASATNSHDGEFMLNSTMNKMDHPTINMTINNANSMPTVYNESNDTPIFDHNHNPSLPQESMLIESVHDQSNTILKNQNYEHQVDERDEEPEAEIKQVVNFSSQYFDVELQTICDELEKARNENNERNRELKESLVKFRKEIENLKKQDLDTDHDREHANNIQLGFDKYSVLRRSGAGTPRTRVETFDMI